MCKSPPFVSALADCMKDCSQEDQDATLEWAGVTCTLAGVNLLDPTGPDMEPPPKCGARCYLGPAMEVSGGGQPQAERVCSSDYFPLDVAECLQDACKDGGLPEAIQWAWKACGTARRGPDVRW